jgi:6-phosphogluconolactonase
MTTTPQVQTGEPEIVVLADPGSVAAEAAGRIASVLTNAGAGRNRADWATTGGSAAPGIYRDLAASTLGAEVPWARVHLWWGDDRYVPNDHPLSNVGPAEEILIHESARFGGSGTGETVIDARLGIEPGVPLDVRNIHPIRMADAIGEGAGPSWAAARYEIELRESGIDVSDGWPVFDLVLLGVGPDGHVMSVFPGSDTFDRREWVLPVPAPAHVEPHVSRVTLNPAILDVARNVVVVVTGAGKAETLATVFGEERDPRRWPAQLVRRPGATWLLDEAAATRLPSRP